MQRVNADLVGKLVNLASRTAILFVPADGKLVAELQNTKLDTACSTSANRGTF